LLLVGRHRHVCTSFLLFIDLTGIVLSNLCLQHIQALWALCILASPVVVNLLSTAVDQLLTYRQGP